MKEEPCLNRQNKSDFSFERWRCLSCYQSPVTKCQGNAQQLGTEYIDQWTVVSVSKSVSGLKMTLCCPAIPICVTQIAADSEEHFQKRNSRRTLRGLPGSSQQLWPNFIMDMTASLQACFHLEELTVYFVSTFKCTLRCNYVYWRLHYTYDQEIICTIEI